MSKKKVETDAGRLQLIFDALYELIETFPQIITLGAEVIPILQPVARAKKHPLQVVAAQLIQNIAPTTLDLQQQGEESLVCPQCLTRCGAHEIDLSWLTSMTYFGCRTCHQSKNFYTIDKVIAILDNRAVSDPIQQGHTLTVNWLQGRTLFDFDIVEIIQATDEEVERFAVQVGNDTDPVRQSLYKEMRCLISPNCQLSDNTTRVLQRTFGSVKIG